VVVIDRQHTLFRANDAAIFVFEFYGGEEWPKYREAHRSRPFLRRSNLSSAYMLDSDHAALARIQNALVNEQEIYAEQKRKLYRLATAGAPTHDASDTLGLLETYLAILQRHRDYVFAAAARKSEKKRKSDCSGPVKLPVRKHVIG
jgi:hypothetical protein